MSGSVDRLTEVLRVGLRLREDLAGMPTGVRWENGKVVSVSKEERALLLQLAPREDMVPSQPPSLRKMWRFVNKRSQDDLLEPGSGAPGAPGPMDDDGFAPSDDEEAAERRRAAQAAQAAEDSEDSEDAPLARRGTKRPDPGTPKAPKARRSAVVVVDDDSDDNEPPVNPWRENYEKRQALEAARKAAEAAEAARKAAEAAEAEAAAKERAALVERYRLAEEAAKARAEAEAKAKAEAEAAAAAKAAAEAEAKAKAEAEAAAAAKAAEEAEEEGEGEGEGEEEEDDPEPEQPTVTLQEAWDVFKLEYDKITRPAAKAAVMGMTEAEIDAMFPIITDFKEAIYKGKDLTGTIRVTFCRIQKKDVSEAMSKDMPMCPGRNDMLRRQQHFVMNEPDALQAGANEFSKLFKRDRSDKPVVWKFSKAAANGYTENPMMANWLPYKHLGSGVYFFNCTFVTHKPFAAPPTCQLSMVMPNWELCYRWIKAAEAANAALKERFDGVSPKIAKYDGPQDSTLGAIGYDTPLVVPDWAKALFPDAKSWSDFNFPSIVVEQRRGGLERRVRFGRGGQTCAAAAAVLAKVVEANPVTSLPDTRAFSRIYSTQLEKKYPGLVKEFMDDDNKTVCLAAWGNHARTVYKDKEAGFVFVYDPWKQTVRPPEWFTERIREAGYHYEFVAREAEQAYEGSCQLQATMRVLIGAIYGREGIEASIVAVKKDAATNKEVFVNPHLQIFPVVTQMAYGKYKPAGQKGRTFRRRR